MNVNCAPHLHSNINIVIAITSQKFSLFAHVNKLTIMSAFQQQPFQRLAAPH